MENKFLYYGGFLPWGRHGLRVVANRVWSRVLRRTLARSGPAFNVDFTSRILGGSRVSIGSHFYAGRGLKLVVADASSNAIMVTIGDHVGLNEYVTLAAHERVSIGDHVLIGSRVYLGNINHGWYRGPNQSSPDSAPNGRPFSSSGALIIEANVWLGEGVMVPGGITVGQGSIVGAGSVVTKDVPPNVIVAGNPARIVKQYDRQIGAWIPISPSALKRPPGQESVVGLSATRV